MDDVSFTVGTGQVVGLVGESGSGKTTVGRTLLRLIDPTSGTVNYDGTDIASLSPQAMRPWRRRMQYIFQDPYASLSPRMTVGDILTEGLVIQGVGNSAADWTRRQRRLTPSRCRVTRWHATRTNSPVASASASASPEP